MTSIQLNPEVARMFEQFLSKGFFNKAEVIKEALRQYIVNQELQNIRDRLTPYAQAKGIWTDEEANRVFK